MLFYQEERTGRKNYTHIFSANSGTAGMTLGDSSLDKYQGRADHNNILKTKKAAICCLLFLQSKYSLLLMKRGRNIFHCFL